MSDPHAPRVCSFESRRQTEMRQLIERQGGRATVAPSMREIPLEENPEAFQFAEKLLAGQIDLVVFMTGVGARGLLEILETRHSRDVIFEALAQRSVIVRGPKPLAVLREWKVRVDHRVPEPNTSRELFDLLNNQVGLSGKTIAVQEYGEPSLELYQDLTKQGAEVVRVPVYRWAFPEDTEPLRAAIAGVLAGEFDLLLFTSAHQLANVLQAAEQAGQKEAFLQAAQRSVIGSIGPTASEKLREAGLPVHVEASPPKMGTLVRAGIAEAQRRLASESS